MDNTNPIAQAKQTTSAPRKLKYIGSTFKVVPEGFYFVVTNSDGVETYEPASNADVWREVQFLRRSLHHARSGLFAIKTGVINVPPEHSYGDWTTKRIKNLKEAQEHAAATLRGEL